MQDIEFYYDFGSPKSYFVHKLLPGIAKKHGMRVVWKPLLLGGVFKLTNNQSPMETFKDVKGKLEYDAHETARFVTHHQLPYQLNPHFPVMTIGVMRGAIYAQDKEFDALYRDTVFNAIWEDQKKMDDPKVIMNVLEAAGLPAKEIISAIGAEPASHSKAPTFASIRILCGSSRKSLVRVIPFTHINLKQIVNKLIVQPLGTSGSSLVPRKREARH